jgi:hypothetical protein
MSKKFNKSLNFNYLNSNVSFGSISANTFTGSNLSISGSITSGSVKTDTIFALTGITTGNINFTGNLYQNGLAYVGSQWTNTSGSNLSYTSGIVVVTNNVFTNVTATNMIGTNISSGTVNASIGITTSNISVPGFINTQTNTINTQTIQPNVIGSSKDGGINYWNKDNVVISDTTYVNWGPVYNEYNLSQVRGISNVSGTSLSVQIRITGTARNGATDSDITGTFYITDSSGNLTSTIYEYTVDNATPGEPPFGTPTPGTLSVDTGYITVTIPQGGSIQSKDNYANDSTYLTIQNPYVYINVLDLKTNIPTIISTNATVTNVSTGVVIASTGITTGTIKATGLSVLANATVTNVSTGVVIASTGITTGTIKQLGYQFLLMLL